jgi:MFS family permease
MSAVLDVSKPTPLRLFGFLFTALGGLLMALGSISDWATVVFLGQSFKDSATPGIDLPEGKAVLALGILMLVAIVAMRLARTIGARRVLATGICIAAAAAISVAAYDVVRADERFGDYSVDRVATGLSQATGLSLEQARNEVESYIEREGSIDVGSGLWLVLGGGALGLVGGLLDLAWVSQQRLRAAGEDEAPTPSS